MKHLFELNEKNVVVFGCGILGAPTVKAMLDLGAHVVVSDIDPEKVRDNLKEYAQRDACRIVPCNLRNPEDIRTVYETCRQSFGSVNAGINLAHYGSRALLDDITEDDFIDGIEGGLTHVFRTTKIGAEFMEKSGGGVIVNTASMYGVVTVNPNNYRFGGNHNPPAYGASKAAVLMFSKYCAAHYAGRGIRVNCVTPGPFPDVEKQAPAFIDTLAANTMLGRVGKPEEIAGAFCYLISDAASYVTGANLIVDGGWTAW